MAYANPSRRGGLTERTASHENILRQGTGYIGSTANNSSNRGTGSNPSRRGPTMRWAPQEDTNRMHENIQRGYSGNSRPASSSRGGSSRRGSFAVYHGQELDPTRYVHDTPPPSAPGSSNGYSTDESMAEDVQIVEVPQHLPPPPPHAALPTAPQFDPSNQPPHNVDPYYCPALVDPSNFRPPFTPPRRQLCRLDQPHPNDSYKSPSVYCMREPVTAQQSEYFMDHPAMLHGLEYTPRALCIMRWVDPNGPHPLDRPAVVPYSPPDSPTIPDSPDRNGGSRRVNYRGHNGGYGNQPDNTIYLGPMYRRYP